LIVPILAAVLIEDETTRVGGDAIAGIILVA